jgi:murein L,D-transpeptidase YcbB/YkuD
MLRYTPQLLLALMVLLFTLGLSEAAETLEAHALKAALRSRLGDPLDTAMDNCHPEADLSAAARLHQFYARRDYDPAWLDAAGLKPAATAFLTAMRNAETEGLDTADYPLATLEFKLAELLYQATSPAGISPQLAVDLDIELSLAALAFGRHLALGRITPASTGSSWYGPLRSGAWQARLDRMLTAVTAERLTAAAAPAQPAYSALRSALERYHQIAAGGGWSTVPSENTLELGVQSEAVILLRQRLEKSGDILPEVNRIATNSMTLSRFDTAVATAVARFQERLGLKIDGKAGKQTLAALNVPVETRIATLRVNMERRRWVPAELGDRHLRVNIPAFELEAVVGGRVVKTMRVVVGRPKRPTPVLTGQMTYLELNPYWHVPPRIARKDILPKVQADPDYLLQQGFRVFSDWTAQARELDPRQIDWTQVSQRKFPYKLRQDPAVSNALGRVKFMFPNKHSIYLHDTPAKGLFKRERRSFSSGCVRVAQPRELAALLLADMPAWKGNRLADAFDAKRPAVVRLKQPMPVHLQYWTAWVDTHGRVQFRADIYNRDRALLQALKRHNAEHLHLASCPAETGPDSLEAAAIPPLRTSATALGSS